MLANGAKPWMHHRYSEVEHTCEPWSRWAVLKRHLLKPCVPQACMSKAGISYSIGKTGSGEKIQYKWNPIFGKQGSIIGLYKCVSFKLYRLQNFVYANTFVISLFYRRIKTRRISAFLLFNWVLYNI